MLYCRCVTVVRLMSVQSISSESFFFFKQKTAYEMRISDWSSDVCSSDLTAAGRGDQRGDISDRRCGDAGSAAPVAAPLRRGTGTAALSRRHRVSDDRDRKSVVEGESVSVRVALGGRAILKKKKTPHDTHAVRPTRTYISSKALNTT